MEGGDFWGGPGGERDRAEGPGWLAFSSSDIHTPQAMQEYMGWWEGPSPRSEVGSLLSPPIHISPSLQKIFAIRIFRDLLARIFGENFCYVDVCHG